MSLEFFSRSLSDSYLLHSIVNGTRTNNDGVSTSQCFGFLIIDRSFLAVVVTMVTIDVVKLAGTQ